MRRCGGRGRPRARGGGRAGPRWGGAGIRGADLVGQLQGAHGHRLHQRRRVEDPGDRDRGQAHVEGDGACVLEDAEGGPRGGRLPGHHQRLPYHGGAAVPLQLLPHQEVQQRQPGGQAWLQQPPERHRLGSHHLHLARQQRQQVRLRPHRPQRAVALRVRQRQGPGRPLQRPHQQAHLGLPQGRRLVQERHLVQGQAHRCQGDPGGLLGRRLQARRILRQEPGLRRPLHLQRAGRAHRQRRRLRQQQQGAGRGVRHLPCRALTPLTPGARRRAPPAPGWPSAPATRSRTG